MEPETVEDAEDVALANTERDKHPPSSSQPEPPSSASSAMAPKERNAFTELMARKPSKTSSSSPSSSSRQAANPSNRARPPHSKFPNWRGGLLAYIQNPSAHPDAIVRVTADTVLLKDLHPKAAIHLLLLPRSPAFYDMHPFDAFEDAAFLAMMRREAASAARLAAAELERRFGRCSASNAVRNAAMDARCSGDSSGDDGLSVSMSGDAEPPAPSLPEGRDWLREIRVGVHAHPSMQHLHVHVASRDMCAASMRKRQHYNSFNTPFFVPLADFPLVAADQRRQAAVQNANLKRDFVCWRCGEAFGNRFAELKRHLEVEFEEWKRE